MSDNPIRLSTNKTFEYREPQLQCLTHLESYESHTGLINIFCGVGKTHVFLTYANRKYANGIFIPRTSADEFKKVLIVFPKLVLASRQIKNYLLPTGCDTLDIYERGKDSILTVCSNDSLNTRDEKLIAKELSCVTDPDTIRQRLSSIKGNCYVITTYNSLPTLFDTVEDNFFDLCIYDEAHKFKMFTTDSYTDEDGESKLDYQYMDKGRKHILFTATPLYDEPMWYDIIDEPIYQYSYWDALNDRDENGRPKNVKEFELVIFLHRKESNLNSNQYLIDAIKSYGSTEYNDRHNYIHNKWLFYHQYIGKNKRTEGDTAVTEFVKNTIDKINKDKIENIKIDGIHGGMNVKERNDLIEDYEKDNERIRIISSSNTIAEGVDIRGVSAVCFIDPRKSNNYITQVCGRPCRIHEDADRNKKAIILIPIPIDESKYKPDATPEEKDELLRKELAEGGDWNALLNVCSALMQSDLETFKLCLSYPKTLSPKELAKELKKSNHRVVEDSTSNKLSDVIKSSIHPDEWSEIPQSDVDTMVSTCDNESIPLRERLQNVSDTTGHSIQMINDSIEQQEQIITEGDETKEPIKLIHNTEDKTYSAMELINKDNKTSPPNIDTTEAKKTRANKKFPITISKSSEITVLWDIESKEALSDTLNTAVLKSTVSYNIDNWKKIYNAVESHIIKYDQLPSRYDKDEKIKRLGQWVSTQKHNYNKRQAIMKNDEIRRKWELLKNRYSHVFLTREQKWNDRYDKLIEYINENGKLPSEHNKDPKIKELGRWVRIQKQDYKNNRNIVSTNSEIKQKWEDLVNKHPELFKDKKDKEIEIWNDRYKELIEYINENGKLPPMMEKGLGQWVTHQKTDYKNNINIISTNIEIRQKWEDLVNKYPELFKERIDKNIEKWNNRYEELIEYINDNGKLPSQHDKDEKIKRLGEWVSDQKKNYKSNKCIISTNIEIRQKWEELCQHKDYSHLFPDFEIIPMKEKKEKKKSITVADLRKEAKELGIKVTARIKKEELIEKINEEKSKQQSSSSSSSIASSSRDMVSEVEIPDTPSSVDSFMSCISSSSTSVVSDSDGEKVINPVTKRPIKKDGPVYKKLIKDGYRYDEESNTLVK